VVLLVDDHHVLYRALARWGQLVIEAGLG